MQSTNETLTTSGARKGREQMSIDKIDLADFNQLLSLQTTPTTQPEPTEPTPTPPEKEIAQQKAILKVYRKYQRQQNRSEFPDDYFFSALAELVLDG